MAYLASMTDEICFFLLKKKKIIISNSTIAERMKSSILRVLRKVDIRQVFKKISFI